MTDHVDLVEWVSTDNETYKYGNEFGGKIEEAVSTPSSFHQTLISFSAFFETLFYFQSFCLFETAACQLLQKLV